MTVEQARKLTRLADYLEKRERDLETLKETSWGPNAHVHRGGRHIELTFTVNQMRRNVSQDIRRIKREMKELVASAS